MAQFNQYSGRLINLEKGFVDNPNDSGGATKYGITLATWQEYGYDKNGDGKIDVEDLKLITPDDARKIAKNNYWDYFKADDIRNQSVAEFIVDWGYNSGKVSVARRIQRLLKLPVDGVFGKDTLKTINSNNQKNLFEALKDDRKKLIEAIVRAKPSQMEFYNGWMNRINGFFFLEADEPLRS